MSAGSHSSGIRARTGSMLSIKGSNISSLPICPELHQLGMDG